MKTFGEWRAKREAFEKKWPRYSKLRDKYYEVREEVYQFGYNLQTLPRNIWKWRHVVFNDRDHDYLYILAALQLKLVDTQNHIKKHKMHLHWEIQVEEIEQAIESLQLFALTDDDLALEMLVKSLRNMKNWWC